MTFTIFGATGDLTTKKLIPALYNLYEEEELPKHFNIIGIGRRPFQDEDFVAHLEQNMSQEFEHWEAFKAHIKYYAMDISDPISYIAYKKYVEETYDEPQIFYLATAPRFFPIIAQGLIDNQIVIRGDLKSKIVFEKPFGDNLSTAKSYNRLLLDAIDESQVYRIDHYLGKEMVQNIITVRFSNKIFENIWNADNIESVKIVALESETVKQRGGYYDKSGALKDMVQNHLFQTLALVAMDPPSGLNDRLIKNEKVKVMEHIQISEKVIFGQYDGYLQEKGIPEGSNTETFVALKAYINMQRWRNVPFYLITGKKMDHKSAYIEITFKESDFLFEKGMPAKNKLRIEIFPREGIEIQFNGKAPGLQEYTMPMKLDYCHLCNVIGNTPEAYEKLISDVIHDDATLFTRWDEIEASWKVIDHLQTIKSVEPLYQYKNTEDAMEHISEQWQEEIKV